MIKPDSNQRVYLDVQQYAPKAGVEWSSRIHMWVIRNHTGFPEFLGRGHIPYEAWQDALKFLQGIHGKPSLQQDQR